MQVKRQFQKKTEEELQRTRNDFRSVNTDRSTNTSLKIWNDYCIGRKGDVVNLFYDGEFDSFRNQLKSKYNDLLKKGLAKIEHTKAITKKEYLEILKAYNCDGPINLLKLLILNLGIHLGLRGGTHNKLQVDQFKHKTDDCNWKYYEWVERTSKVRNSNPRGKIHNPRIIRIYENSENEKCCYYVLKNYLEKRPNGIKNDAFYAQPNCNFYKNKTGNWFKRSKLGKNAIYKYFKEIVSSLKEKKIVLHSLRATAISWLEKKGMDFKTIAKISGHRDPRSMEKYLDMGNERKREISNLLSEVKITNGGKEKEIQIRKRKRKNDLNFGEMINGKTNNLHFKFGKTSIQNFSIVNNYASRNRSPKKKLSKYQ
ncbi:hypothetical protein M0813_23200 [Anaeramoeba flamelloides]|uniref:Tyr recombinase domain-containing protein n=1 Tax=Anaeramoeba flamelloides TaxID=1746091 RepID=A0ABQ8YAL9_9EUKA|nr:hypothetical protein M0813_23200 [Anaeramoeba flamelloides]